MKNVGFAIETLVKSGSLTIIDYTVAEPVTDCVKNHLSEDLQIYIKLSGFIDLKQEISRLDKRSAELVKFRA